MAAVTARLRRPGRTTAPAPVGDRSGVWRRRLAYAILTAYALLMFVPFAWTVVTSLKTLPDSTRLTIIPSPFTTAAWEYTLTNLRPSIVTMFTWTLPQGLTLFRLAGGMTNDWPPLMAVVVIATVPSLVLSVFFERYFAEGIAASGIKG